MNVLYIPWDPPQVLYVADLLMDSITGCQGYYCYQWGLNPLSYDDITKSQLEQISSTAVILLLQIQGVYYYVYISNYAQQSI